MSNQKWPIKILLPRKMARGNETVYSIINGGDKLIKTALVGRTCPYCGSDKFKIRKTLDGLTNIVICGYDLCEHRLDVIIELEEFKK
jgi:hypothetical protein